MSEALPSLVFIPDISGFTSFVTNTEATHGQHIIAELLEILIDTDELGLTISEVEGDAILFYKHQQLPTADAITQQAKKMFLNFHGHLKKYESQRICQCGACKTAFNLTLKIIVHAGNLEFIQVKDHTKLYGSDLILAHRLLKNNIEGKEYILFTSDYLDSQPNWTAPEWAAMETGSMDYSDLRSVDYQFASFSSLHQSVPDLPAKQMPMKSQRPVVASVRIDKSVDTVFETIIDFEKRMRWNKVAREITFDKDRLNQIGAKHVCVFDTNTIEFETVTNDFGQDQLVYGERVLNPPKIIQEMVVYFIVAQNGQGANVQLETHYELKPVIGFLASPFIRRALGKQNKKTLQALKEWCETII